MADSEAALKSRPCVAFIIRSALVCLKTGNPWMTTQGTDSKVASKSRRWVAFSSGWPWFAWRQGQPVDGDEINGHQGGLKKPALGMALGCLFIRPALICLETGNPGMTTKGTDTEALQKAGAGLPFYQARPGLPGDRGNPWVMTKETDTKAASKSRRLVGFSSGQPWVQPGLPENRQPGIMTKEN